MPVSSRSAVMVALAIALAPALARADFTGDYITGLAALDHGEYARAVQYLKKALDAQSDPVSRVTIEGNPQPYLPHHFLGMAYLKLGDCAAARKEWNDPINLRMLGHLRQLRTQEEQLAASCNPSVVAPAASASAPAPAAASSTTTAPTASSPPQRPAAAPTASASLRPAASGPPDALVHAYEDFVAGRYARAARVDVDAVNGTHVRFQAYLLRSAARFALSRSGESGQLEGARSDAHAALQLEKSAPDERVFSPAFRAFYAAAH